MKIEFPESLPVSAQREQIMAALSVHQVIIVCGETGSGKTTQLPKMALALGRGRINAAPGQRGRLIGHTQPRRIAATSVAKRIAQELDTPLGEVVGYKVRFQDRLAATASVKLMTDGILLAETQSDPLLQAYDTLIIDEAHERSLNIDFLLGYLKQILPRRPDLKVIVTSATIDAERFARHFAGLPTAASGAGPAQQGNSSAVPVLLVSGRSYPVELRWRPFEESRDYGLNEAIADAVDELWLAPASGGDILVFLPGEREIREAADHLRSHLAQQVWTRDAQVLPLFARLSQAEQERVFETTGQRRIVLATNVAETSLTVPGIRYVIDAGTARVKRYSLRSKVEQLLVEPISQAAANQRAGRCGRVAAGVCIRLYDEADFNGRPRFTDPEILRSSLAAVILRMKSLRLGPVQDFAFLEPPSARAITDGYQLLAELGAVDEQGELTDLGEQLAKLPLDPRVGRMILEARQRQALDEVLVVAAALSLQDVRDRPLQAQAQADQAHAKFDDDKSEFSGYLKLWRWIHAARGGAALKLGSERKLGSPKLGSEPEFRFAKSVSDPNLGDPNLRSDPNLGANHKLSRRQYEALLRQNFINIRRVREWIDVHSQLLTVVREHGWRINTTPASYEQMHQAMLAGLLGNIGCKIEPAPDGAAAGQGDYLGARGIKFHRHPGAHLSKRPGRWIVVSELVETTRLFGRGIAAIEPQWIEQVAGHLLKKQVLDPHWEKKAAEVMAFERATLYGLVIYSGRRVLYSRVDPQAARELFIREALVAQQWASPLPFLAANAKLIGQVQELEHKSRRQDVLVDDELIYAYYDQHLPAHICSGLECERWYRSQSAHTPKLLHLTREELMRHEAAGITTDAFPKIMRLGGVDCAVSYLHEPGDARDGVTVTVPLFVLNQVSAERCEWLVPGMLQGKVLALLKSLPQKPRSRLVPLPDAAQRLTAQLCAPERWAAGALTDALLACVRAETGLTLLRSDFKLDMLAEHLFMNLRVVDEHGRQLGMGRNLAALKAELGTQARGAFQALAALKGVRAAAPEPSREPAATPPQPVRSAGVSSGDSAKPSPSTAPLNPEARYTAWSFGPLPELLEIEQSGQRVIGFPALIDQGDAVTLAVFDEPDTAAARHRAGLRRLFALQIKDTLKSLEKNIPQLNTMAAAYMQVGREGGRESGRSGGGTLEQLREQIISVALERAFLAEPWPQSEADFNQRLEQGRTRLVLIAHEVARLAAVVLQEHGNALRKLSGSKVPPAMQADISEQLQRLCPLRFLLDTPWAQLQHLPRYLQAITLRLDKWRSDPARDAARLAEIKPQEERYRRLLSERKGVADARVQELRWLLEELRVSFFAQELRTPQPVSIKRLDKLWAQLQ